jgi:uncharacterized membrane protein
MIQIANVPYYKTYKFPYFSDAMALKIVLYAMSLLLPFFMVYSVNSNQLINNIDFYLSFKDNSTSNPIIKFDYNYDIQIDSTHISTIKSCGDGSQLSPMSFSYLNNEN